MQDIIFDPQMTSYDMASLESLVEALKPEHTLEIGSWKGLSTSILARHSKAVYCVDTWEGAPDEGHMVCEAKSRSILDIFLNNLAALRLRDKIKPCVMTSQEAIHLFRTGFFSFIYIDGDHTYDRVKEDLEWWDLLNIGGIMAGHDYDAGHQGVVKAVQEKFGSSVNIMDKSSVWFIQKVA